MDRKPFRSPYFFLPIFYLNGKRWRVRMRWIESWKFRRVTDLFPEGQVHRLWLGKLLITAIVDIVWLIESLPNSTSNVPPV